MKKALRSVVVILSSMTACFSWAAVSIDGGGSISLGQGTMILGGGDLQIDGQFDVAAGSLLGAGNITVNGTLDGGSGTVTARGDWRNNGSFNAGTGLVRLLDDSGSTARLTGTSSFHSLSMSSTSGGHFMLDSGQIQRVADTLTIRGTSDDPVQLLGSSPPQAAELLLEPDGSQSIAFVGVSDVHATGQPLAPGQTNQGGSGNDRGWFDSLAGHPVPALSLIGLMLLILAFLGTAAFRRDSVA